MLGAKERVEGRVGGCWHQDFSGWSWAFSMYTSSGLVWEQRHPCADAGEMGKRGYTWAVMEDYEAGKQEDVSPEERAQQSTRKPMTEQQGQLMPTQG